MGFEAAHLAGGEVGDDDDAASDEVFGGVPLSDAGEDLALFVTEVDFEAEELVGLGDAFGDEDLGDAEVDLDEVVDGDLRGGRGGVGREDTGGRGVAVRRGRLREIWHGSRGGSDLGAGIVVRKLTGSGAAPGCVGSSGAGAVWVVFSSTSLERTGEAGVCSESVMV